MGHAFEHLRLLFDDPGLEGLRQSHARVLEVVADGAARSSDVATALGMTKQGAGQLIATLVDRGLLARGADPSDARARALTLTPQGAKVLVLVHEGIASVEQRWSQQVGAENYAVFRSVLEEIGVPSELPA